MKLDIGCGVKKTPGCIGVDIDPRSHADVYADLFKFPWPFDDNTVDEVYSSHFVEHIPHYIPGHGTDGWYLVFGELWRICKPGAKLHILHPYAKSDRAWWDPTHTRAIEWMTWNYLSAEFRVEDGPDAIDFEVVEIGMVGMPEFIDKMDEEQKSFMLTFLHNGFQDLNVELVSKKK